MAGGGGTANDFPDLKALENLIGMKTPEGLVVFMKDEAHWNTAVVGKGKTDNVGLNDSISEKIQKLKLEMSWLRSADVRILRQLASVHDGMEALRWLMEERGALASDGSSPTSSVSSLTAEEHEGPFSPTLVCLRDSVGPAVSDAAAPLVVGEGGVLSHESSREDDNAGLPGLPHEPRPRSGAVAYPQQDGDDYSVSACVMARRLRAYSLASARDVQSGGESIQRALVRANTARVGRACRGTVKGGSAKAPEEVLFDYDAQWHWVESLDDVTFM